MDQPGTDELLICGSTSVYLLKTTVIGATYVASARLRYQCEADCGFEGTFAQVALHEDACLEQRSSDYVALNFVTESDERGDRGGRGGRIRMVPGPARNLSPDTVPALRL